MHWTKVVLAVVEAEFATIDVELATNMTGEALAAPTLTNEVNGRVSFRMNFILEIM